MVDKNVLSGLGIDVSLEEMEWDSSTFEMGRLKHSQGELYEAEIVIRGVVRVRMSGPKFLKPGEERQ